MGGQCLQSDFKDMEEKNEKISRFTGCLGIIYAVIWIM
jgi:hypothetical protein